MDQLSKSIFPVGKGFRKLKKKPTSSIGKGREIIKRVLTKNFPISLMWVFTYLGKGVWGLTWPPSSGDPNFVPCAIPIKFGVLKPLVDLGYWRLGEKVFLAFWGISENHEPPILKTVSLVRRGFWPPKKKPAWFHGWEGKNFQKGFLNFPQILPPLPLKIPPFPTLKGGLVGLDPHRQKPPPPTSYVLPYQAPLKGLALGYLAFLETTCLVGP